jgi:signal peptidase II
LDRARNGGHVVDFLNVGVGPLRTGVFNVADVAIVAGALGLLWASRSVSKYAS